MAGLLDPLQGNGSYVENRPSKWAQTWGILGPYVTGPFNAMDRLWNSPAIQYGFKPTEQNAADAFSIAGLVTGGSAFAPKPQGALMAGMKTLKAAPPLTLEDFAAMAQRGTIRQAKTDPEAIKAVIAGKQPATELNLLGGHPLARQYEMGQLTDRFAKAGLYVDDDRMGRVFVGRDQAAVDALKNAKTPAQYGRAYGYSEDDIAHFYVKRRGGDVGLGYDEYLADHFPKKRKALQEKVQKMQAEEDAHWEWVKQLESGSHETFDEFMARKNQGRK